MYIETYNGWKLYYSGIPRPLYTATKGMAEDIHTYVSVEELKDLIDKSMVRESTRREQW